MGDSRLRMGNDDSSTELTTGGMTDSSTSDDWSLDDEQPIATEYLPPSDAVLVSADNRVFDVHRAILAAASPFFLALFNDHFKEARQRCVHLHLLSSKEIRQMIRFAYTGRLRVDANTAQTVLDWATLVMLDKLADQCAALLIRNLSANNCVELYRFAAMRRLDLHSAAWRMLIRRYDQVAATPSFQTLSEDELLRLHDEEQLNASASAECGILETWLAHDEERARTAVNVRAVVDSQRAEGFPLGRRRVPNSVLLAIGGWAQASPTRSIETLDVRADRWVLASRHRSDVVARAYHGIVTVGSSMYIIGGFNGTRYYRSLRHFNINTQEWSERGPMQQKRCYVSCAALNDNNLLAIGGYNGGGKRLNTAEIYDIERNQWTLIAPMTVQRSDSHAVYLNDCVYMAGGFDGVDCKKSAEFYDVHKNAWFSIADMQQARSGVSAFHLDGTLYYVGGFDGLRRLDSVEMFDPREGKWRWVASMLTARSNFGIEAIEGELMVAGGYDGSGTTALCERYDRRANKWSSAPLLNLKRSALFVTRIDEHDIIRSLCYPPYD